ncbi:MAG: 2-oxoglutarate dehydrogenase complex dihydrolipoyllysine-residue succinyltransferase [Thermomicrobiales bacterium]
MAIEIKVPPLGESLVDAVVGQWLKSEGDAISRGETILELETDKVNLDVTAEDDGVLSAISKQEGEIVTVGEVLGTLDAGTTGAAAEPVKVEPGAPEVDEPAPVADDPAPAVQPAPAPAADPAPATAAPAADAGGDSRAAPIVKRMAEEHGIDLATVAGTGPGGRITRDDIVSQVARQGTASAPAANVASATPDPAPLQKSQPGTPAPAPSGNADREERVRLSRRRQTIATRLVEAQQTAAMLTTFNEIDMNAVMELRTRRKDAFKERNGVNLGFMSFFTKATIGALKAFPQVNAEIQGTELVLKKYYDIGIAVGVEDGLVVPVIRDADRMSFAGIEKDIVRLAGKARDNSLAISDLTGGTFTITNGGIFGSLMSTPILNAPQVGILGMHTIQQRPVARDGEVVIRPMMYVALSYDHRIVDGREAVQFLVRIKELIEDPESLLIEG